MTLDLPLAHPTYRRGSDGPSLAVGLAVGMTGVLPAVWWLPWGLLAAAIAVAVLAWRRSRQMWAGALVGVGAPLGALAMWGSLPWLAPVALSLVAVGLALALLAPDAGSAPRLGTPGAVGAGLAAGAFMGVVLLSSLALIGYLPLVLVVSVAAWAAGRAVLPWLVLGASLMPWFISWSNRGGPGTRCGGDETSQWCTEMVDPSPFLAASVALTVLGIAAAVLTRRR